MDKLPLDLRLFPDNVQPNETYPRLKPIEDSSRYHPEVLKVMRAWQRRSAKHVARCKSTAAIRRLAKNRKFDTWANSYNAAAARYLDKTIGVRAYPEPEHPDYINLLPEQQLAWCEETFGSEQPGSRWALSGHKDVFIFLFREVGDAVLFKLSCG